MKAKLLANKYMIRDEKNVFVVIKKQSSDRVCPPEGDDNFTFWSLFFI